jgi:hypothetical protein
MPPPSRIKLAALLQKLGAVIRHAFVKLNHRGGFPENILGNLQRKRTLHLEGSGNGPGHRGGATAFYGVAPRHRSILQDRGGAAVFGFVRFLPPALPKRFT